MKPRTLLVMLALVALLGAFIFFEKDLPGTDERRELAKKVLTLETGDVQEIEIAWQDQRVQLRRSGGEDGEDGEDDSSTSPDWRLVEPYDARADRTAVDGLLSSLTGLEKERTLEDVSPDDLGFDEPEAEVTLRTAEGDEVLVVGPEVPGSSDRLVTAGGGIYQVAGAFIDSLTREPGGWRDKDVFTATRSDIERFSLDAGREKVLLAKRGEDFWIESPISDRADEDHVNDLLAQVTGLRVREFVDEASLDLGTFGLEPPHGVLEVILAGREEPFRFELGQPSEEGDGVVHGRAEGHIFEIETALGESLDRTPTEWRSRSWTALEVFKIESARLEDAEGALELSRDGADWRRGEERIDYTTASDVLYALVDAEATRVVERAAAEELGHELETPELEVVLGTEESAERLSLYPPVDGVAAATSDQRDAVLLMALDTATGLRDKIGALRSAEALPEEDEDEDEPGEAGEDADGMADGNE